jgi:ATP synthase protein I
MNNQLKLLIRITMIGIAALLLIWAFFPAYRTYASGLALGMIVSLINAWLLLAKIEAVSRLAPGESKRINIGTLSRMCMALIAVMIAVKYPQFHLVSTIIGLFFIQLATLLMGLLFIKK